MNGSRWFTGDRDVFVLNTAGDTLVYPPNRRLETANLASVQDNALQSESGRRTGVRLLAAGGSARGCGWVHYRIPRPGQQSPEWKSTYVERFKAPDGTIDLVGRGAYASRMDKAFAVDEVEAAAALIARDGRKAFAQLRDPKDASFFMTPTCL